MSSASRMAAFAVAFWMPVSMSVGARSAEVKLQSVTVRPGDTLWSIANTYLKDPTRWNEILRYNRLPSSDPTVALPGKVLRIPVALIKENLRAAVLVYRTNHVLYRRKEQADWQDTALSLQLYRDDSLRTLAASRARVQFVEGDLLSLDENSMAILRPKHKDYDLELLRGAVQATRSKVVTASTRIIPKTRNTEYSARVRDDLSTRVEVYKGAAEVEGDGQRVEVRAGFATDVLMGRSPEPPVKLPKLPDMEARISEGGGTVTLTAGRAASGNGPSGAAGAGAGGGESPDAELKALQVGIPVAAYRVQASRSPEFERILFDRVYDADEPINLGKAGLPAGRYWWRIAALDLLGSQGKFSQPRQYEIGGADKPSD